MKYAGVDVAIAISIIALAISGFAAYNEVLKSASMELILDEQEFNYSHVCLDRDGDLFGNITVVNTGFRPIVLSRVGKITLVCPNYQVQVGGISFMTEEKQILFVEQIIRASYTIASFSGVVKPAKNCSIIFGVESANKAVKATYKISNVAIRICRT